MNRRQKRGTLSLQARGNVLHMGSFGELRISQQEVIQGAKFCQSSNDLAVSSVPRVVL